MINSQKTFLERKHFYYEKEIGSGTWGRVYKARYVPDSQPNQPKNNKIVAIKSVYTRDNRKHKITGENAGYIEQSVKKETFIHAELSHPNIVKLYSYINNINVDGYFYLIMEYVGSADLYNLLNKYILSLTQIIDIMLQTTDAIAYCHSKKIMHRDIKLENILYFRRNNTVKLIDFGLATRFLYPLTPNKYENCGTPEYQAYEMVCNQPYDERIDIWSLGIVFVELLTGKSPFYSDSYKGIENNIKNIIVRKPNLIKTDDPYFHDKWDIIEGMLERYLDNRITLEQLTRCLQYLKLKIMGQVVETSKVKHTKSRVRRYTV